MSLARAIAILLVVFFGMGASCVRDPAGPAPAVVGGSTSTGGATATGGVPQGGSSVGIGGSSGTDAVTDVAAVEFPVCNQYQAPRPTVVRSLSGWKKSKDRAKHRRLTVAYKITASSVFHAPNVADALDQGTLGSCTGNAMAHCLSTWPFALKLTEDDAVQIYKLATTLDPFLWSYPPTDGGSDGASAAKAAKKLGHTTLDFAAVDTVEGLTLALGRSTCVIGVDWDAGFETPTKCGEAKPVGKNMGGHEIAVVGWDADRKVVWFRNSWGAGYGVRRVSGDNGYAYWSVGTLQRLLAAGAELDCPVL